ncbi:MAG: hypothetical protein P4L42_11580 [Desulfocapsaceae bacterium]|nr:hypothetical protein [Desulfocapsaceae bacterium]
MEQFILHPDASAEYVESVSNPLVLADFMNALQRLFRIGVYYPSGHIILDQATDRFLTLLAAVAQQKHFVRIEEDGDDLLLEKIKLDASQSFVVEFKKLMASLNVVAMEINRSITREELRLFVQKMIAIRSLGANSKQFALIEISDLPASVSITHKQFLAPENDSEDGRLDNAGRSLTAFFDALASHGLSEDQINECRRLLASLPRQMGKIALKSADLPFANWNDVAALLAQAVQGKPLSSRSSSHGNLDMLASILSNLERDTQDRKAREAINLLVSIIRKPALIEESKEEVPAARQRDIIDASVSELQDFTNKNMLSAAILLKIQDIPAAYETLSVLLQLAQDRQSVQNQTQMLQFLNDILIAPPNDRIWEILTHGLYDIVRSGNRMNLSVAIRLIIEPLRRLGRDDSLVLFLKTIALCKETEVNILWPFALNELLICGSSGNIDTYRQIYIHLAGLPWKDMVRSLPVLQGLDAFTRGVVAADVFTEISPSCYPLCAFLLRTSIGPQIGGHVIAGLRNSSSDMRIQAVALLLDPTLAEHKTFLDSYLRHSRQGALDEGVKLMAGNIIVKGLAALSQEQRGQPWVPDTISFIADLPAEGGRELLRQIENNKRLLVIPEWPAACRKSAREAARKMIRRDRTAKAPRK